jgi:hypothetical protein
VKKMPIGFDNLLTTIPDAREKIENGTISNEDMLRLCKEYLEQNSYLVVDLAGANDAKRLSTLRDLAVAEQTKQVEQFRKEMVEKYASKVSLPTLKGAHFDKCYVDEYQYLVQQPVTYYDYNPNAERMYLGRKHKFR